MNTKTLSAVLLSSILGLIPSLSHAEATGSAMIVLGDSIDWGYDGGTANPPVGIGMQTGWAPTYLADLISRGKLTADASIVILAVPGETAKGINQNQLSDAKKLISLYKDKPLVVTISGGGNELLNFIASARGRATCLTNDTTNCLLSLNALINNAETQLDLSVKQLKSDMQPDQKILIRTYAIPQFSTQCSDSPFPGAFELAFLAFEGTGGFGPIPAGFSLNGGQLEKGLNDRLRGVAEKYGATVVEVFPAFTPFNPGYVDLLIGEDCTHPSTHGYNLMSYIFSTSY